MRARFLVVVWLAACGGGASETSDAGGVIDAPMLVTDAETQVADAAVAGDAPLGDCATGQGYPETLSCTGLYADFAARTLADGVREFRPGFQLWSDGAEKTRWIYLPPGTTIDVSDPEGWVFPVGTRVWKEFRLNTTTGVRPIETRLLEKHADGWIRATYVWSADGSRADEEKEGVASVAGTDGYSVPPQLLCGQCHQGRADELLGFEGVLLAAPEATGLTYAELQRLGLLSSTNGRHTRPASSLQIPGTAVERKALGMLHANCGISCHNPLGNGGHFNARLEVQGDGTLGSVLGTNAFKTLVNQVSAYRPSPPEVGVTYRRIRPLDVAHSTTIDRMNRRGFNQMPPIATSKIDTDGVAALSAWVNAMSTNAGYPAPAPLTLPDAGIADAGAADARPADAGVPDAPLPMPDAGVADAPLAPDAPIAMPDAPLPDAAVPDAAPPDAAPQPDAPPGCTLPNLKLLKIGGTFNQPLFVGSPPGDESRLFVVEKGGSIKIIKNGVTLATPFITVSDVGAPAPNAEGGLLGLAFHPSYATNGRFYLHYTSTPLYHVVVREFHRSDANPDVADPDPVKTFIDAKHGGWNHAGGMLAFAKNGYLYIGIGDTATQPSPAPDLDSVLGKILRVDVDNHPTPPPGNAAGGNPYVFLWGLRNPWRFSFDRDKGTMYIGDVGEEDWEEIDVQSPNGDPTNFGWDSMEGTHCYPPGSSCTPVGKLPVIEHSHASGVAGSIIGGYVYRGNGISCLRGRYVYADYRTGHVLSFVLASGDATDPISLTETLDPTWAILTNVVSLGEDASGELYFVNISPGEIYALAIEN